MRVNRRRLVVVMKRGAGLGSFSDAKATADRRLRDDFLVEARDARGDDRPAVAALSLGGGLLAAAVPLAWIGGGLDQCGCERLFIVGGYEPAALAVADDLGRAVCVAGDHGEAAGHRLDERETERFGDRWQDERVGGVQRLGELL